MHLYFLQKVEYVDVISIHYNCMMQTNMLIMSIQMSEHI